MDFDDFFDEDVVIGAAAAAAVTAALASPQVRSTLRKGLVYGLAGLLVAKDRVTAMAQEVATGARESASPGKENGQQTEGAPG